MPTCRLYLITPSAIDDLAAFGRVLAEALDAGDVAALQIRLKDADDEVIAAAVDVLSPICHGRGVAVILNDRPDLAARFGCDGVHVGQGDAPLAQARKLMGKGMVGVTCHDSRHLAMEAAEGGADYVAFGAFFPTSTKETGFRPDPEILTVWQETMEIRHRRRHGGERRPAGAGGRGLRGGVVRRLGLSRRSGRCGEGDQHGDQAGALMCFSFSGLRTV